MTIIGTTIGAGFASGREIWEFFGFYGEKSYMSILLSMLLFFLASIILLHISWKRGTKNYSEVLRYLLGKRMAKIFDWVVFFFLCSTAVVMIAGSGATFRQWKGDDAFTVGCWLMVLSVFVVLLFDIKGLMWMNTLLVPILLVILIMVCVQFNQSHPLQFQSTQVHSNLPAWPSAITYAAFNIISLLAVLSTMGSQIQHRLEIWFAGICSASCLAVMVLIYNFSLLKMKHLISQYEIPLFALIQELSPIWVLMITAVLWLAIYTTAISNVHGLVFRLADWIPWPRWLIACCSLLLLTPLSQVGFTQLVQFLYPLYGVLNLFILSAILLYPFTENRSV